MLSNHSEHNSVFNFEIPSDWIYRGEGNCNLVISLPKFRKILRIRKIERPKTFIGWLIIWISDILHWYYGKGAKEELRDLQFYSTIMRPLIGIKYTSTADQVFLSKKQVRNLEDELGQHRPEFRKHKILQYGRASLFDDFAFLPQDECDFLPFKLSDDTFAIEIKPKQAWKPLSEKHFPKCLFCLNQYFKLEKKKVKMLSKYCPEDMFSGDSLRMKQAVKSLIETPQNNFKIFKNGVLCYGEKVKCSFNNIIQELFETTGVNCERLQEEFCVLIQKCLLTSLITSNSMDTCTEPLFCKWNKIIQESNVNNILPKGCVLEKILSVQMLDSEGVYYYSKLSKYENLKDWAYINTLLNKIYNENTCLKCTIMMSGNIDRNKGENYLTYVPYLISAIARDCSLMITLKKIQEYISDDLEVRNIIKTCFGHYLLNIGVFDLYPKPLSTIKKHYKRNADILRAYTRTTEKSVNVT